MSRFKMKEETFQVRDMDVTIRELSQTERTQFVEAAGKNKYDGPAFLVSLGTVSPKMTPQEWQDEPADVIETLTEKIMVLSNMKRTPIQKEPDARRAVPVQGQSGDGASAE